MKLKDKVVVITGATSGIGKSIAVLFAQEGAKVVAVGRNTERLAEVEKEIKDAGGIVTPVQADVQYEEQVAKMIDAAVSTYGTVDVLVNNAGIMDNFEPAGEVTDAVWEKIFAVNVTGPMRAIRKVVPIFLEKEKGVIINIASIAGTQGCAAGATYTASKHANVGLVKNTAFMYADKGIRCNAIAPGGVNTNIGNTITHPSERGFARMQLGMNTNIRMIEPIEIANVALFLASDDSSAVNGAIYVADTGMTAY